MTYQNKHLAVNELEPQLRFQAMLAELSADFVRVSSDEVDDLVQESLRRIAENLELDHVAVGLLSEDGHDFYSKYQYANQSCVKPWLNSSLRSEGPYLTKTLLAGQPSIMHDVEELPPEATMDREGFLRYGIKAHLAFPIIVGGHLRGGIGFASSRPRQWHDNVVRGLGLMADVFANALERKHNFQALQSREEQMRLASEAADVGLWVWNIASDTIWATDRARKLYGVSLDHVLNMQRFLACLHPDDCERVKNVVEQAFRSGGDFKEEYRVVHPDGSEYWICATGKCQFGDSGQPERMMGASLNITEKRRVNDELRAALEEIQNLQERIQQENVYLRDEVAERKGSKIVNGSEKMRRILEQVTQVAATPASVLISGETGTGKELLARAIHEASPRKNRSMIQINCAAIPAALIESELFGREKGAFTGALSKQIGRFELANGSTLFLDEVGELPSDAQAKLLRVLQEKQFERLGNPKPIKVDVRIIAATNRNLSQEVAQGRFREDLYYRLNVFPVRMPPLRERREDIPKLIEIFVQEFAAGMDKTIEAVDKNSLQTLCRYDWPGNIRELRNVIERAVILAKGPLLKIALPVDGSEPVARYSTPSLASLEGVERQHILHVLEACGWRVRGQGGAAAILGLNPNTLESRMTKLGIRRPCFGE
ncbi:sigma 54-interacting transcriptional regulator [Methylomonas sp. SURF-2]|uniref:Sigma 54-interacting transcriptional regulator n=1 Tax=Methylomonas subterranea TaxID=2952225 RepID=A0ABT1TAT5_9GAMM|nr:sigma 54-interacting transcriptional regulator [Methylomonas sp. SURF-2]MCQ8102581.1 sigma 54-interacting transcriptional regulator [Methylomonas sp. SURF-2]